MLEIKQGSNSPIKIEFDERVAALKLSVVLHNKKSKLKQWREDNFSGSSIELPLSETETMGFDAGTCYLEVKLLDSSNTVVFFDEISGKIVYKYDKTLLTQVQ